MARQREIPTPAAVRTWIQAYPVMSHIDKDGIAYNAADVELEIRALFDAGLTGGYTTWLSTSNIKKYELQEAAFAFDYLQDLNDKVDWRSRRREEDERARKEAEEKAKREAEERAKAEAEKKAAEAEAAASAEKKVTEAETAVATEEVKVESEKKNEENNQ